MILYLDLETFSAGPDLRLVGAYRYAQDAEVQLFAYAFDDGPVQVWDLAQGEPIPEDLQEALDNDDVTVVIHNSAFDRVVMKYALDIDLPAHRIHDTMLMAYCHGLPGSLDMLGQIYGLDEDEAKKKEGRRLVLQFCKPRRGKVADHTTHPEDWELYREYAAQDVTAMRILYGKLPRHNYPDGPEYDLWVRDQAMNDRGFAVDVELAKAAVATVAEEKDYLDDKIKKKTEGEVDTANKRDALLKHILAEYGVKLPDLQAATVERRLNDPDLPLEVKNLLAIRQKSSKTTASKYQKVIDCEVGGRLFGTTQFAGASRTLRDAGRLFQHQNLARPTMWGDLEDHPEELAAEIEKTVQQTKDGALPFLYDDPIDVLGNLIRSVIIAPEGRELHVSDLSNIEGRILVWLAGEDWKTDFFRDFDAGKIRYDNYVAAYAKAMNVDPSTVNGYQRNIGKVLELALGYEGGVTAFLNFADVYYLNLDEMADAVWETGNQARLEDCQQKHTWAKENGYSAGLNPRNYAACEYLKQMWREAHAKTTQFWRQLKETYAMATLNKGVMFRVGKHIRMRRTGDYLLIRLPSGKSLTYLKPFVEGGNIGFWGMDNYTRKFGKIFTHGGKLAENVTSATARDVLFRNIPLMEENGFDIVFRVHDEVVAEAPAGHDVSLSTLLARNHKWCEDLPLAADGFICTRYRK